MEGGRIGGLIERGRVVSVNVARHTVASLDRPGVEYENLIAIDGRVYQQDELVHFVTFNDGTGWIVCGPDAADNRAQRIFYQDNAPASGMLPGDVWFDTNSGNAMYEYTTDFQWVLRQFGEDSLGEDVIGLITTAQATADSKAKVFYQNDEPDAGMSEGDLWMDLDGGNALWEYKKTGSNPDTFAWTLRQLGTDSIAAGAITAAKINVLSLSAITANLGSVIVGGLNNEDGVITIKDANNQTIGYWDNTGINASAGYIGNWNIVSGALTFDVDGTNVTTISTELGIEYYDQSGFGWIHIDPGGRIAARSMHSMYPIYWLIGDETTLNESYVWPGYYTVENRSSYSFYYEGIWGYYNSALGMWLNGSDTIPVVVELTGLTKGASIKFNSLKDGALLTNYYNSTTYSLIRNHNNGNISISASGGALYLGYENTTFVDLLHGCHQFGTYYTEITNANSPVWLRVRNAVGGNAIFIQANTTGTVELASYGANGTRYEILARANNSNDITAYGAWTFHNGVVGYNYTGRPVVSLDTDTARCSMLAANGTHVLTIQGQWNSSSYSTQSVTVSSSDIRLKENIKDSKVEALPFVNSIKVREFDWKQDGKHQTIGVVADELEELDENLAVGGGKNEDGTMNIKSVDTFYLLGYAIKAIQELSAEVNRLKGAA